MRYIPTFRFPVSGFFVNTSGNVMNRPPSCGQHFRIGKSKRLTSLPFCITSLHGPLFTLFGKNDPSSASFGSILTLSKNPCGVSIFRNPWMRSATSSSSFTSNASAIRRTPRRPRHALRHFRNLQHRINLRANPLQFPFLLQLPNKLPQVSVRHRFLLWPETLTRTAVPSRPKQPCQASLLPSQSECSEHFRSPSIRPVDSCVGPPLSHLPPEMFQGDTYCLRLTRICLGALPRSPAAFATVPP